MKLKTWGVAAVLLALLGGAQAGRSCEARLPGAAEVARSLELATATARKLDASGAQVVVLARAGQDLSRWGLRWSHLGFAYREPASGAAPGPTLGRASGNAPGVWRVVHKLNHCGSSTADLYRQGLAEFFLDDLFEHAAGVVVLRSEVQAHLLPLLQDNARVAQLHQAAYSMVAYPWAQTYQQSNQWAIETLALAEEPAATTRDQAQAWLRSKGYQPTTLHINAFTRLGARVGSANIAFDDHPSAKRFADRIETVSVDSVFSWLERSGLGAAVQVLR